LPLIDARAFGLGTNARENNQTFFTIFDCDTLLLANALLVVGRWECGMWLCDSKGVNVIIKQVRYIVL